MKAILYFFGSCIVIGLLISILFTSLPTFPYASKALFLSLSEHHYSDAYSMFSASFKKQFPYKTFIKMSQNSGLEGYREVNWIKSFEDKKNKKGYLIGVVTTKKGDKLPIQVFFVQEDTGGIFGNTWRVADIKLGKDVAMH